MQIGELLALASLAAVLRHQARRPGRLEHGVEPPQAVSGVSARRACRRGFTPAASASAGFLRLGLMKQSSQIG